MNKIIKIISQTKEFRAERQCRVQKKLLKKNNNILRESRKDIMFIKQKQDAVERGKLKNKEELRTGQPKYQFNTKIGKDQKISQNICQKDTGMENG